MVKNNLLSPCKRTRLLSLARLKRSGKMLYCCTRCPTQMPHCCTRCPTRPSLRVPAAPDAPLDPVCLVCCSTASELIELSNALLTSAPHTVSVNTHTHTHTHTHADADAHAHVQIYTYTHTHTYAHTQASTRTDIYR